MEHDVLLGYLVGTDVAQSFSHSLMRLIARDVARSHRLAKWSEIRTGPLMIPDSRNELCRQLVESELEWLFMVDADMGFDEDTLDRLLDDADPIARPVIGGLCFSQRDLRPDGMGGFDTFCVPTILNLRETTDDEVWGRQPDGHVPQEKVVRYVGIDHYPVNMLLHCGATGAACLLVHRSALERIAEAEGQTWFDRSRDAGGLLQGEDVSFCERLAKVDVSLYVDTGIRTTHAKTNWLSENDFWMRKLAPPATERVEVIVPVLHRPQNVPMLLQSLFATTGLARPWLICEPRDREEQNAARRYNGGIVPFAGTFARKVNAAYRLLRKRRDCAEWIFLCGDDVRFRPSWLDHALDVAHRYHVDVVGTNDLWNPRVTSGEHATHMLIRRSYIEEVGASWDGRGIVCHEGYRHWCVDDEIVSAARLRQTFQMALGSQVEHLHPYAGKAKRDDIYALGEAAAKDDRALFERRLASQVEGAVA